MAGSALTPTAEGDRLGKYRLLGRIASGGMADVFVARLEGAAGFAKRVVIKRILPHLAARPEFVAMFLREAHVASSMSHPNICQVFELGESCGEYFLAMEYLDGISLSRAMRRLAGAGISIDLRLAAAIITQACDGLHYAHELADEQGTPLGVVHRDVSPQNLMLTTEGVVKVLDFGVAKVATSSTTRAGEVKGKHAYMPPEQLRGQAIDRRADVFAIGVCAWELIAARRLFRRDTDFLTFEAIIAEPIPRLGEVRPGIPPALDAAVMRALERDVDGRFATAQQLGEAMLHAIAGLGPPMTVGGVSAELRRLFATDIEAKRTALRAALAGREDLTPTPAGHKRLDIANQSLGLDWDDVDGDPLALVATPSVPPERAMHVDAMTTEASHPAGRIPSEASHTSDLTPSDASHRRTIGLATLPRYVLALLVIVPCAAVVLIAIALRSDSRGIAAPSATASTATAPNATVPSDAPAVAPPVASPPSEEANAEAGVVEMPEVALGSGASGSGSATMPPARPPPRGFGFLTIDAKPFAKVYVDGREVGVTPLFRHRLPVGTHRVRAVSAAGTKTFTITVARNGTNTHNLIW